jgi:hypothetical protein
MAATPIRKASVGRRVLYLVLIARDIYGSTIKMHFITVTRPDGSKIALNTANILSVVDAPPPDSPVAGPPGARTRITFSNQTHQDVTETVQEILELISKA